MLSPVLSTVRRLAMGSIPCCHGMTTGVLMLDLRSQIGMAAW